MMIKRLIFDVDGTLIVGKDFKGDIKFDFTDAIKRTLMRLSIFSEYNVQLFLNGISTYEFKYDNYNKKDYTEHFSKALNTNLPDDFLPIFFEELKSAIPPKSEALINTIYQLSQKYELVLLTNYFSESQLNRLNNMGIGQFFSQAYGEKRIKPNKEAYVIACGDKKPSECVMIGDDLYLDIQRAQEEGINTIFVNTKQKQILENIGIVVNSVEQITLQMVEQCSKKTKTNLLEHKCKYDER